MRVNILLVCNSLLIDKEIQQVFSNLYICISTDLCNVQIETSLNSSVGNKNTQNIPVNI